MCSNDINVFHKSQKVFLKFVFCSRAFSVSESLSFWSLCVSVCVAECLSSFYPLFYLCSFFPSTIHPTFLPSSSLLLSCLLSSFLYLFLSSFLSCLCLPVSSMSLFDRLSSLGYFIFVYDYLCFFFYVCLLVCLSSKSRWPMKYKQKSRSFFFSSVNPSLILISYLLLSFLLSSVHSLCLSVWPSYSVFPNNISFFTSKGWGVSRTTHMNVFNNSNH